MKEQTNKTNLEQKYPFHFIDAFQVNWISKVIKLSCEQNCIQNKLFSPQDPLTPTSYQSPHYAQPIALVLVGNN